MVCSLFKWFICSFHSQLEVWRRCRQQAALALTPSPSVFYGYYRETPEVDGSYFSRLFSLCCRGSGYPTLPSQPQRKYAKPSPMAQNNICAQL